MLFRSILLLGGVLVASSAAASTSVYPLRPDDPEAVYVTSNDFPVRGDGVHDDTAGLQQAIDRVQETTRRGIVFIPEGRCRLSKTLLVWSGIRLIGYGATRPVFVLGPDTPGFQEGPDAYLVHFVSDRPESPDQPVRDANPGTFYSAMSNIDIEIAEGNPAAVGVRAHFAQHGFLAHMDFHVGSARAGVEEAGNLFENLRFFGGEFGITMHKPSPSWPFVLLDATFEGQRRAAIETEEGGLTILRAQVKNVPAVILVRPDRCEELWIEDSQFENISGPALVISDERSARTQINLENVTCVDAPVFAAFRESGRQLAGAGEAYRVKTFCHGLHYADLGATPEIKTTFDACALEALPPLVASETAALPPMETWVNVRSLGAKGDGVIDDTAALRAAIAQHRAIYLPSGWYRVTDTLELRPGTALIGLDPTTTRIVLSDFTEVFHGRGAPKPMLVAPPGGSTIVTGVGLDTGGANNRAVALKWMAGSRSLVDDVRFLGGHGTYAGDGSRLQIYNNTRTADPDNDRKWAQYWSLWVADGGGGTFKNIWTPSPYETRGVQVRSREIAWLHLSGAGTGKPAAASGFVSEPEPRAQLVKVADGFTNIDGLAVDGAGDVYFVDQAWHRIHRWSPAGGLSLVTDSIRQPVALSFDRSGNILVVARDGHVYALPPGVDEDDILVLAPRPSGPLPSAAVAWLPTNRWRDGHDWLEANTRREPFHYVSPDGSIFIPAPEAFVNLSKPGRGWGTVDLARAYALAPARAGEPFYVSDEFDQTTWRFTVQPDGTLAEPHEFAQEGEAGTAVDAGGNVYVCAGHVFVYDPAGSLIDVIETPERPSAVAFGGPDHRTLFIAARTSLYAVRMAAADS
ncbi:MAG: glycosyl hydrolase family 28-related protein [Opitutaceae bacterium]